jgi:hypothetical protein
MLQILFPFKRTKLYISPQVRVNYETRYPVFLNKTVQKNEICSIESKICYVTKSEICSGSEIRTVEPSFASLQCIPRKFSNLSFLTFRKFRTQGMYSPSYEQYRKPLKWPRKLRDTEREGKTETRSGRPPNKHFKPI